jgi:hypothetical protein
MNFHCYKCGVAAPAEFTALDEIRIPKGWTAVTIGQDTRVFCKQCSTIDRIADIAGVGGAYGPYHEAQCDTEIGKPCTCRLGQIAEVLEAGIAEVLQESER